MIDIGWYNANSQRGYPLDDQASGADDAGTLLPTDILVDCQIRFPDTLGQYAFVSGISSSAKLLTLTIAAADQANTATTFTPLAAVSLLKPVDSFRHYTVSPLAAGVAGFVVFQNTDRLAYARFSSPAQSRLLYRCARPYKTPPVTSLIKSGLPTGLSGDVRFAGRGDIVVDHVTREIAGSDRDVIRFRLASSTRAELLKHYTGPCGGRPESRTCNEEGIVRLGGVTPDCNGNIQIKFRGFTVGRLGDCNGLVLDQPIGLADLCASRRKPAYRGNNLCLPQESSGTIVPSISISESIVSSVTTSSSSVVCESLPWCESFDGAFPPARFRVVSGDFDIATTDSPDESCGIVDSSLSSFRSTAVSMQSLSSCFSVSYAHDPYQTYYSLSCYSFIIPRTYEHLYYIPYTVPRDRSYLALRGDAQNLSVWDACAYTSVLSKRVTTDLKISGTHAQRNGGVILNYREVLTGGLHKEYILVLLDQRDSRLKIYRFTGQILSLLAAAPTTDSVALEHWYRLVVNVENSGTLNSAVIQAEISGVTNPGWGGTAMTLATNRFGPPYGLLGLATDRSRTAFSWVEFEDTSL